MEQEQSDEIEVLMSIFPEEFELISKNPWEFKLHLSAKPGSKDNHGIVISLIL
jgi:hypothetical protein